MSLTQQLLVGGVYAAIDDVDGAVTIQKVLALDEWAAHIRYYAHTFDHIPQTISTANLDYSLGHIPVSREGMERGDLHLITVEPVHEHELEGYHIYLEAMQA